MSKLSSAHPPVRSILVVDDEKDIRESLKEVLEFQFPGVQVHTAADGAAGLALFEKEAVDLIVSDYRMPGMDGLEMLRRARDLKPHVPRILITAYPELNLAMRAINEAQISNFLTKPLKAGDLLDVVRAALVKARAQA